MFSYRAVLKKAFDVVLKHRYLWFFGLFATFLASGGHFNLAFGKMGQGLFKEKIVFSMAKVFDGSFLGTNIFIDFGTAFRQDPMAAFSALVFLLMILVLFAFFIWLIVASEIAIINNSAIIIKKNKKTSIKEGIDAGFSSFWPVLGINMIGRLFVMFLLAFISLPLIFISHRAGPAFDLLYILLFLVFLPIALIVGFLVKYASAYVVLSGKKFIESIEKAWGLFLQNWLVSIESAFIIVFIHAIVCLLIFFLILVLATPYIFITYILASLLSSIIMPEVTMALMISLGVVVATILVVVLGSALTAFKTTAWTNIFIELDSKRPTLSKLIRIFG